MARAAVRTTLSSSAVLSVVLLLCCSVLPGTLAAFDHEFLVPGYHILVPVKAGHQLPDLHYCGTTISNNLVLATAEDHCHGHMKTRPALTARQDLPAGAIQPNSWLATTKTDLNGDYPGDKFNLIKDRLRNLYTRGYGLLPAKAGNTIFEVKGGQISTATVKGLKPAAGACQEHRGQLNPQETQQKAVCKALFGEKYHIQVKDDQLTRNNKMQRLNQVIVATKVQGISLEDYFKKLVEGGNKVGVVGGAVRDTLVGSKIADVDIATSKFLKTPANGIVDALTGVWNTKGKNDQANVLVPGDLDIDDVLKLEGIRKMFGMALLDKAGKEPEGLDVGPLKVKRPMPFVKDVPVKKMHWEPKIKMQPDGKVAIKATLGLGKDAKETEQIKNYLTGDYVQGYQDAFGRDPQKEETEKLKNTFVRVGEFRDLPHSRIFELGPHKFEPEDYAFDACLKFIRNYMPDKFVTHLALKKNEDFHNWECFRTGDTVDLDIWGNIAAGNQTIPEVPRPDGELTVRGIYDWGFGIASSRYPPSLNSDGKSRDGVTGSDDEDLDEAQGAYAFGYSYYQDAKQRDYRINAVYAVWADDPTHAFFADPLAKTQDDSGYADLITTKVCVIGNGANEHPECQGEADRTKCCQPGQQQQPDTIAAPLTVFANEEAYEQDLGGQFRFFKMLRKGYSFKTVSPDKKEEMISKVCRFMLLRLNEVSSAKDEKIMLLFFKRMWKKLFDETERFHKDDKMWHDELPQDMKAEDAKKNTVFSRLLPLYLEMREDENRPHCYVTWNSIVRNAGQLLYGPNNRVHRLLTAIIDDQRGAGYMDSALGVASSFEPVRVHYDDEADVPDTHARHLAAHVVNLAVSSRTIHDMKDVHDAHAAAFEEWLDQVPDRK